jgi:hypothetical protein
MGLSVVSQTLCKMVVLPAFARPIMRTRNWRFGLFAGTEFLFPISLSLGEVAGRTVRARRKGPCQGIVSSRDIGSHDCQDFMLRVQVRSIATLPNVILQSSPRDTALLDAQFYLSEESPSVLSPSPPGSQLRVREARSERCCSPAFSPRCRFSNATLDLYPPAAVRRPDCALCGAFPPSRS